MRLLSGMPPQVPPLSGRSRVQVRVSAVAIAMLLCAAPTSAQPLGDVTLGNWTVTKCPAHERRTLCAIGNPRTLSYFVPIGVQPNASGVHGTAAPRAQLYGSGKWR